MLLDQLREMKHNLNNLAAQYGASHLRVFGSVARREETPRSDVDFLVELPQGYDLFAQRLPLAQDLSELLHRKVDVIPEHELSPYIRAHVLDEAVEL